MAAITESKLIKTVEQFPGLYDPSHPDSKNPIAIASTWAIVSTKCSMKAEECYDKWKKLRKRFIRSTGPSTWPHYESMKFLEPFINRRKRKINDKFQENHEAEEDVPASKKRKSDESEAETVKAFCQSLSSDLLQLSTEKQLSCRIDIMVLIQKYLSSNSNWSLDDTTAVMKIFSKIEEKIVNQKMPWNDPDWAFVYCIKNLFSNMMSLRYQNEDMENVLHEFDRRADTPTYEDQYRDQSDESDDVVMLDVPIKEEEKPVVISFEKLATKVNIEEPKVNTIRPPHTIETMKKQILSNGIDENKKYCNICEIKIDDNSHIYTDVHIAASKRYHLPYGVFKLNPVLFRFENNMPKCIPCEEKFNSKWDLVTHIFRNKEKHREHYTAAGPASNPQFELLRSIKRGIFYDGDSFSFCFLCNKHCEDKSHDKETHLENYTKTKPFCRFFDEVYCFCCGKLFDALRLANHINKKKHKVNYEEYFARYEPTRSTRQS